MKIKAVACYSRHKEYPALAEICNIHNAPNNVFERCLKLHKERIIPCEINEDGAINPAIVETEIPRVVVNLGDIDPKYSKFHFAPLPKGDPRGLVLGYIVTCCQSVGSNAEPCAIEGAIRPDTCFYVLVESLTDEPFDYNLIDWTPGKFEENHNIIAQSYLWNSISGNLVFDSFECSDLAASLPIKEMFDAFVKQAFEQEPSVSRVLVGKGGGTQKVAGLCNLEESSLMETFSGYMYPDSRFQLEIAESQKLAESRSTFLVKTMNEFAGWRDDLKFHSAEHVDFCDLLFSTKYNELPRYRIYPLTSPQTFTFLKKQQSLQSAYSGESVSLESLEGF